MGIENPGSRSARVEVHRDFPPGCGTSLNSHLGLKSVHGYTREFPPGCGTNTPKTTQICPKTTKICPVKRLSSERDSGSSGDYIHWRRPVGAVRSKPPLSADMAVKNPVLVKGKESGGLGERKMMIKVPLGAKMGVKRPHLEKGKGLSGAGDTKERDRVLEMLKLFRERCEKISRTEKWVKRVDTKAHSDLKKEGKLVNQPALMIGAVPGVEVGDKFHYRIELVIVGLHRLPQGGIDSMEYGGSKLATCIVANEGHFDKMNDPNVLIYVGEGGTLPRDEVGDRIPPDQQLKGGNRALLNSLKYKKPVRVVRGLKLDFSRPQKIVYVYDGLYDVEACQKKKGPQGNMIFEFQLTRCPGQPVIPWKNCRWGRF
uniref:[histone H3]-lysine(4) N-trimethyltransferase n=1 Tax=Opuntia streptacantha TaxID=393608 RepID=A0A7C9DYJ2_OPUST